MRRFARAARPGLGASPPAGLPEDASAKELASRLARRPLVYLLKG